MINLISNYRHNLNKKLIEKTNQYRHILKF